MAVTLDDTSIIWVGSDPWFLYSYRSVFFHFGMMFRDPYEAIVMANEMGGAEIRIKVPDEVARDIVFHYQLRFAAKEFRHEIEYKGAKLDRFVFQSMLVDEVCTVM